MCFEEKRGAFQRLIWRARQISRIAGQGPHKPWNHDLCKTKPPYCKARRHLFPRKELPSRPLFGQIGKPPAGILRSGRGHPLSPCRARRCARTGRRLPNHVPFPLFFRSDPRFPQEALFGQRQTPKNHQKPEGGKDTPASSARQGPSFTSETRELRLRSCKTCVTSKGTRLKSATFQGGMSETWLAKRRCCAQTQSETQLFLSLKGSLRTSFTHVCLWVRFLNFESSGAL